MEEIIANIFKKHNVFLGYIFGSHARGTAGPMSDIDVAVFFLRSLNPLEEDMEEREIKYEIQNAFEADRVDVINFKKNNNIALGYKILFEGKALVVLDEHFKHLLEMKYLREFEDIKYFKNNQFNILKNKLHVAD